MSHCTGRMGVPLERLAAGIRIYGLRFPDFRISGALPGNRAQSRLHIGQSQRAKWECQSQGQALHAKGPFQVHLRGPGFDAYGLAHSCATCAGHALRMACDSRRALDAMAVFFLLFWVEEKSIKQSCSLQLSTVNKQDQEVRM